MFGHQSIPFNRAGRVFKLACGFRDKRLTASPFMLIDWLIEQLID